jgi:hypothetical protein
MVICFKWNAAIVVSLRHIASTLGYSARRFDARTAVLSTA